MTTTAVEAAAPTLRSRQLRREASDRGMLRAALALISRHGTVGASMAQIGIDAGYSRGLPVQRFGTKLALLEAAIDAIEERFLRKVAERTADKRGLAALSERISYQIEAVQDMPEAAIALYHLIVDATGSMPELKPRIAELLESYRKNLRGFFEQAAALGELREDIDIDTYVRTISGTISGVSIQSLIVDRESPRLRDDARFIAAMYIRQIARDPAKAAP